MEENQFKMEINQNIKQMSRKESKKFEGNKKENI